jgi:hypothetical protein
MPDVVLVTALYASPQLDVRDAYATARKGAARLVRRTVFVDVYDHRAGGPNRGADVVVVAVTSEEVGTLGVNSLLDGAVSTYKSGQRNGFCVAVVGSDTEKPVEAVCKRLAGQGYPVRVEAVADLDEFRDIVQGWLCAFAIGAAEVNPAPVQVIDPVFCDELYPFGGGL